MKLNVPNSLSLLRIVLVPIIVVLMLSYPINIDNIHFFSPQHGFNNVIKINDNWFIPVAWLIALVLFVIASITDFVDGYIARKYKQVTDLGKFLDPVADKILVTSTLLVLAFAGIISGWIVIIIICRDLIIGVVREVAAKKQVAIAADKFGKYKTAITMVSIVVLMVVNNVFLNVNYYSLKGQLCLIPMYISLALTIISMINYLVKNWKIVFSNNVSK